MRSVAFAWLLVALGCTIESNPGGTGVGNPGSARPKMSRVAEGELTSASVQVEDLVVERCNGTEQVTTVGQSVDLLNPAKIDLPGGELCSIELRMSAPITVDGGRANGNTPFTMALDVPSVAVVPDAALKVDGEAFIFRLGQPGWIDVAELALGEGLTTFEADSEASIAAALRIENGSALIEDLDDDGEIDDDEAGDDDDDGDQGDGEGEDGDGNGEGEEGEEE